MSTRGEEIIFNCNQLRLFCKGMFPRFVADIMKRLNTLCMKSLPIGSNHTKSFCQMPSNIDNVVERLSLKTTRRSAVLCAYGQIVLIKFQMTLRNMKDLSY